jgi:hypothetical protein
MRIYCCAYGGGELRDAPSHAINRGFNRSFVSAAVITYLG